MQKIVFINLFAIAMIAIIVPWRRHSRVYRRRIRRKAHYHREPVAAIGGPRGNTAIIDGLWSVPDRRDFASFAQLFAEKNGEWIGGMGKAQGSQAIRKLMEDTIGKSTGKAGTPDFHLFTDETIQVDGDHADATTKWIFVVQGDGGRPQPLYLGHYEDTMVRKDGADGNSCAA